MGSPGQGAYEAVSGGSGSPRACPAGGYVPRRGERLVPVPLSAPTGEAKNYSRAPTDSTTWKLKGVRYLFKVREETA